MKPHQGLAQAATCQLWPQNFAASASVDLFSLRQLLLPTSPFLGEGQLVILLMEVTCILVTQKSQKCFLAASLFLHLLISFVFWRRGASWDFCSQGRQ